VKSPEAYKTISEVSELLDVPSHVLRFWESKFSQVKPMKRGGGRRYYRQGDIDALQHIRALLYDQGYTIKGAQNVLSRKPAPGDGQASQQMPEGSSADTDPAHSEPNHSHYHLGEAAQLLSAAERRIEALLARLSA